MDVLEMEMDLLITGRGAGRRGQILDCRLGLCCIPGLPVSLASRAPGWARAVGKPPAVLHFWKKQVIEEKFSNMTFSR